MHELFVLQPPLIRKFSKLPSKPYLWRTCCVVPAIKTLCGFLTGEMNLSNCQIITGPSKNLGLFYAMFVFDVLFDPGAEKFVRIFCNLVRTREDDRTSVEVAKLTRLAPSAIIPSQLSRRVFQ